MGPVKCGSNLSKIVDLKRNISLKNLFSWVLKSKTHPDFAAKIWSNKSVLLSRNYGILFEILKPMMHEKQHFVTLHELIVNLQCTYYNMFFHVLFDVKFGSAGPTKSQHYAYNKHLNWGYSCGIVSKIKFPKTECLKLFQACSHWKFA